MALSIGFYGSRCKQSVLDNPQAAHVFIALCHLFAKIQWATSPWVINCNEFDPKRYGYGIMGACVSREGILSVETHSNRSIATASLFLEKSTIGKDGIRAIEDCFRAVFGCAKPKIGIREF